MVALLRDLWEFQEGSRERRVVGRVYRRVERAAARWLATGRGGARVGEAVAAARALQGGQEGELGAWLARRVARLGQALRPCL